MAMSYGSSSISKTNNDNNEYLFVQGASGNVVKAFKKYKRSEVTTETLPDSLSLPSLASTVTFLRYELRLSNTDFARELTTVVSYGTVA